MAVSPAHLVVWSGGIESTSMIKWLLETTSDRVHAHRIAMINPEGRDAAEAAAIDRLLPRLQAIRPFDYDSSYIAVCGGNALPLDRDIYSMLGVHAMVHHGCTKFWKGNCIEDRWQKTALAGRDHIIGPERFHYHDYGSLHDVYMEKSRVIAAVLPERMRLGEVLTFPPTAELPKAWHMSYLGELTQYTWSCRMPTPDGACGRCHSCLERDAGAAGRSFIPAVQQAIEKGELLNKFTSLADPRKPRRVPPPPQSGGGWGADAWIVPPARSN